MSAYVIVGFNPKDKESLQQYGAQVPATLAKFEGELLARGPAQGLNGEQRFNMKVVLSFPCEDKAKAWYHSEDYQALVPLRDKGMESEFQLLV